MKTIKRQYNDHLDKDARRFFGITFDPNEAGYIMRDGSFLDLSRRHILGSSAGRRGVLHYNFSGTNTKGYCILDDYPQLTSPRDCGMPVDIYFMQQTGAIRVNRDDEYAYSNYATLVYPATLAQVRSIASMFLGRTLQIALTRYFYDLCDTIIDNLRYKELYEWLDKNDLIEK